MIVSTSELYKLFAISFLAIAVRDTWDRVCVSLSARHGPGWGYNSGVVEFLQGLADDDDVKYVILSKS